MILAWIQRKRLTWTRSALEDLEHTHNGWAHHPGTKPSQRKKWERTLASYRATISRLERELEK